MNAAEAISDERARELAVEIVSRAEYARFAAPDFSVFNVPEWIAGLLGWVARLYETSRPLWFLLVFGLLALALALLGHVVWTIRAAIRASEAAAKPAPVPERRRLDLEAEALAAEGKLLEAAHAMHLACVERLVQRGFVELRRHDPNRTLRVKLASAALGGATRGEFLRLLDWLEERWFRDPTPDPRDAELLGAWRELHARLGQAAA